MPRGLHITVLKTASRSKISKTFLLSDIFHWDQITPQKGGTKANACSELPFPFIFHPANLTMHLLCARFCANPGNMMVSKKDMAPVPQGLKERNKVLWEGRKGDLLQTGCSRKACVKRGCFNRNLKEEKVPAMRRTGRVLGKGPKRRALRQARPRVLEPLLLHLEDSLLHSYAPEGVQHPSTETPVSLLEYSSFPHSLCMSASFLSATFAGLLSHIIHFI